MDAINESNKIVQTAEKILEQTQEKKEAASFIDFKMVTFSLAGKDYAIDIMHVKEIAKAGRFTYVPNTQPFVLGVYNLRGEIIPILDLRIFFNIEVEEIANNKKLQNLLILTVEDQTFGLVVDKIDKVVGVQRSSIQPPHPLFGDINIKFIKGIVECNERLYVLLDVLRIFADKEEKKEEKKPVEVAGPVVPSVNNIPSAPKPVAAEKTVPVQKVEKDDVSELDIKFISESLVQFKKFTVSEMNKKWIQHRYIEWKKERGDSNVQLQTEADATEFLKPFWSQLTGKFWTEEYKNEIVKLLPENSAKQIVVWNPGCGAGYETYSFACALKEKYPNASIKIYAQDVDLLSVSNASLMSVPADLSSQWFNPYLSKKANGEYTFSPDIKNSIMFEYHDCKNTNVLPMIDIVLARDVLSLCDESTQNNIISDIQEKLKGNGVAFVGENEEMPSSFGFGEKSIGGAIVAYTKD
ncbi:MAG: chemotaxis protein CheW [Treponema sp.]|nr:chemotaxis protein CheW [Treponema sp.]